MRRSVKQDLFDACDALEHLVELLPKLNLIERVDIAARLRGAVKTAEKIDSMVKEDIKASLNHKPGSLSGETFKAMLALIQVTRLDQQRLKVDHPKIFNQCQVTQTQERVTFEVRGG